MTSHCHGDFLIWNTNVGRRDLPNRAYSELIYHGAQPYACVLHAGNTRLTDRASELRGSMFENSMAMVCIK